MDAEDYNNHSNSHLRCPKHSFLYNNSDESGSNEASETHGNDEYVLGGDKSLDHSDSEDFHQDRNVDFNCSRNGQSHQGHHSLRDSPGKHRMVTKTKPWSIDNEKSVTVVEHDPNVSQTVPLPIGNHVLTMMHNNRSCVNESWAVLGNSAPSSIEAGRALSCPAYGNARSEDPSTRHASMSTERRGKRSRSSSSRKQKKKKRKRKQRKRPRPFCMTQTIENFRTFCNQTSLHGWQYIAQKHSSSAKHLFWAMIVSLSMATASFFLYNNTMDFMDATVVTTVDTMTVPLTEVFFPSVVVCNINQVRKSFFQELGIYDNETFIRQIYYDYIEGKSSNSENLYHKKNDGEKIALHEKILKEYLEKMNETTEAEQSINWVTHQKCKDMFILSKWNSSTTYGFEIDRDFGTDYGICCWYTPQLNFTEILEHMQEHNLSDPHWGHFFTSIPKGAKTGKDNGYTMLFDIESFDYSYYDEGSEGLKVALVHHLDMPIMRQTGFHIAPGTENQIAVTPTLIQTSKNAMLRFTPAERDCYSEDEISLKYLPRDHGYRYEMSNCLFESAFENILKQCKCFPGFHTMGGEHAMEHYDVCIGPNLTCMNDLMNRMGQFDHVEYKGQQVKCRSSCEDQINSLFVTTSSYPNRKTLIYREEFCILARRLVEKCRGPKRKPLEREYPNICGVLSPLETIEFCNNNNWDIRRHTIPNCNSTYCPIENSILEYARENLVMFNIFIKDPYAKRFQKDEKITKTSYIANSGGLLGLCMGFSLISGAEILFHCFFGVFSVLMPSKMRRRHNYLRKYCQTNTLDDIDEEDDNDREDDEDNDCLCHQEAAGEPQQVCCCHHHHHYCCSSKNTHELELAGEPSSQDDHLPVPPPPPPAYPCLASQQLPVISDSSAYDSSASSAIMNHNSSLGNPEMLPLNLMSHLGNGRDLSLTVLGHPNHHQQCALNSRALKVELGNANLLNGNMNKMQVGPERII